MDKWLGRHNSSTWMIVGTVIIMSMTVHPSLLAYLFVAANLGVLMLTREVARWEGRSVRRLCMPCVITAGVLIVGSVFVMLKINWIAL